MNVLDFQLVNVFTGEHARGNQCCVLVVDDLSDSDRLHRIARDFNLPATTFLTPRSGTAFDVRWISPEGEIELCGHGALGATHALLPAGKTGAATFHYAGGSISAQRNENAVSASFARIPIREQPIPEHVQKGFHGQALAYYESANKHLVVLPDEKVVQSMEPDWDALRTSDTFSYAITAPGSDADCVSRVLLPHISILEDQATGSAHVVLAEYWCPRLEKPVIEARQASARGGRMQCILGDESVQLKASCQTFGRGTLEGW